MTFGDKLKKLRMTSDFSKEELAEKLSVSKGEINNWENGITEPDYETVKKISAIFGMSTDYFYKEDTVIGSSYSELYNRYNSRHLNKKIKTIIIVFLIIGVITTPFSTAISFYQAFGPNGFIYVLIFEVLLTTTLFIFALRRVLKARYKEDLIAWGIVSLIFISFIAGLIMLLAKDDKDFTVGTVTKNESTPPNLPYGDPETLIKRANNLFIEGRYDAAYRNYLNANRLLGGHNSNCLEHMIRCKTNNLCFIPKDPELLYAIASKREYVTSPAVIDYIDRVKVLIETSYKNAINYINNSEYAKAYDELKYVRPNYLNTKELLAECDKHIKYEAEYKAALYNISNKKYLKAVSILKKLNGYKDSNELIKEYSSKGTKKVVITLSIVVSALIVALAIVSIPIYILPEVKYSRALKLRNSNKTQELDTLMINLSERELKFFRDKQHKYGHTYFEANGNIYEYCLGTSLNVTVVIIPDNCRVICNYAYSGCINLKTIEIPDGVELVGKNAFNMCPIEEAKLPSHLTDSIPKDNLNKLIISSGDTIKANAFKNSPKLSTIYIQKV